MRAADGALRTRRTAMCGVLSPHRTAAVVVAALAFLVPGCTASVGGAGVSSPETSLTTTASTTTTVPVSLDGVDACSLYTPEIIDEFQLDPSLSPVNSGPGLSLCSASDYQYTGWGVGLFSADVIEVTSQVPGGVDSPVTIGGVTGTEVVVSTRPSSCTEIVPVGDGLTITAGATDTQSADGAARCPRARDFAERILSSLRSTQGR